MRMKLWRRFNEIAFVCIVILFATLITGDMIYSRYAIIRSNVPWPALTAIHVSMDILLFMQILLYIVMSFSVSHILYVTISSNMKKTSEVTIDGNTEQLAR